MKYPQLQFSEYKIPYHHIPQYVNGHFTQTYNFYWGHEYLRIIDHVAQEVRSESYLSHLDFGCGDGRLLHSMYANDSEHEAAGVDMDKRAIMYARCLVPEHIQFHCTDVRNITKKYDVITSVEVFEHIDPTILPEIIEFIFSLLNENGRLIVTVPSNVDAVAAKHFQHFDEILLKQYFSLYSLEKMDYLCKNGVKDYFISRAFSNRLFLLNYQPLLDFLYNLYGDLAFYASKETGKHIFACYRKKL